MAMCVFPNQRAEAAAADVPAGEGLTVQSAGTFNGELRCEDAYVQR
jgi:hypothetical protein